MVSLCSGPHKSQSQFCLITSSASCVLPKSPRIKQKMAISRPHCQGRTNISKQFYCSPVTAEMQIIPVRTSEVTRRMELHPMTVTLTLKKRSPISQKPLDLQLTPGNRGRRTPPAHLPGKHCMLPHAVHGHGGRLGERRGVQSCQRDQLRSGRTGR